MKRFVLSPEAERDVDNIRTYLLREGGLRITRHVLRELRRSMLFIAGKPRAGHRCEDLTDHDLLFWPVFSYLVAYDPEKRPVEIVRVIHGARNVPRLFESGIPR